MNRLGLAQCSQRCIRCLGLRTHRQRPREPELVATVTPGEAAAPRGARSRCIQEPGCIQVLPNPDQVKRIRNLDPPDHGRAGARGPGCSTATLVTVLKGHLSSQFGRPHTVLQPQLLTKMPKTRCCHQAFFCRTFPPVPHHHLPLAAGLQESPGGTEKSALILRASQVRAAQPEQPVRALGRHGPQDDGPAGWAVPALACPRQPEQGARPPRAPPAPASCRDTPGWLHRGATTALPAQARSCRTPLGSCRLSALPSRHYSLNASCPLRCQPRQGLWLSAGGPGRQSSGLSEHRSRAPLAPAGTPSSCTACQAGVTQTLPGIPLHSSRTLCREDVPGSPSSLQTPRTSHRSVRVLWGRWLRTSGNARHDGGNSRGRGTAQALDGSL